MTSFSCDPELNDKISLWKGPIYSLVVDAIGNSSDQSLSGSGCLDSVIHYYAGNKLREECLLSDECPEGQVVITRAYDLPCKFVLHCSGPRAASSLNLASCYHSALDLAVEHGIRTIAFPCVATGLNSFPLEASAQVVLQTTRRWLEKDNNRDKIDRIVFVFWRDIEELYYSKWIPSVFPLPSTLTYRDAIEGDTKPLINYWVKNHSILDSFLYQDEEESFDQIIDKMNTASPPMSNITSSESDNEQDSDNEQESDNQQKSDNEKDSDNEQESDNQHKSNNEQDSDNEKESERIGSGEISSSGANQFQVDPRFKRVFSKLFPI